LHVVLATIDALGLKLEDETLRVAAVAE